MCYVIAKDINKQGCFAYKAKHGAHLANMIDELNKEIKRRGIQIVTISRPTAYGEYAPYTFVKDEFTFREKVLSM